MPRSKPPAKKPRKKPRKAAKKYAGRKGTAKGGRASIRTKAIDDSILEQIGQGVPLAQICRQEGMPSLRTVYDWLEDDAALSARFARARKAGYDAIAVEALRIADTPCEGVMEKYEQVPIPDPDDPDGEPITEFRITERRVEDMLGHRKLQVDTRLKLLAKWDPGRYGERLALDHGLQDNLAERMKAARERARAR